jgi:hypothetical protein
MFHAKYLSSSYLGFLKEVFNIFIKGITMTPVGGPIFTPGLLFEQTW